MKHVLVFMAAAALACSTAQAQDKQQDRLQRAGNVMAEILNVPEGIPHVVLDHAECVIVFPSVKKLALGVGASYGRGAMTCRSGPTYTGPWGAPAMYALEGGNIGLQLGAEATDFVLLVVNPRGVESILKSSLKVGVDAAAAIGPKGRDAEAATDALLHAEILTYSRSRGLFAGVSLEGSTLRQDNSANEKLYGRKVTVRQIVRGHVAGTPPSGETLVSALQKASPKNMSDPETLENAEPAANKKK